MSKELTIKTPDSTIKEMILQKPVFTSQRIDNLGGHQVVTSLHLIKTESRRKSWKEQLLSWPWRPWVKFTLHKVPDPTLYVINGTFYCHPSTLDELRRRLDDLHS